LLTGPRGTGKTTTARLLAKAVNCRAPQEERPCNTCALCKAINEGRLLDLIEIDAASNRGIDEIRDIREKVSFRPNEGRYKVYVLDEAHMLTEPAFNALLKTLEEPPPHVIFALVTTDPHKIPATIASRCQRFDFRRIPLRSIADRLAYVAEQEGVAVEPAALELIAHHGTGAMRDAISLLDQLASYGDEITLEQVQMVLGTVASVAAGSLVAHLADGDLAGGLDLINRTVGDGADPRQFAREVVEYLRGLLLVREGAGTRLLHATAEQAAEMEALAERVPVGRLLRAIRLFNGAATDLKRGLQTIPQLPLEMALVESVLEAEGAAVTGQPNQDPAVIPEASPASEQPEAKPAVHRAAEPATRAPAGAPAAASAAGQPAPAAASGGVPAREAAAVAPQSLGGALTLAQVDRAWSQVLLAVRQRNPATQAVLNTGCKPVDVVDNEIVVTFPYPFLREKLGDPLRRTEIQDALDEVLDADCRLRLVLASEYTSSSRPAMARTEPAPAVPAASTSSTADAPDTPEAEDPVEEVPEEISRWAEEHGGQVKLISS
jgi:DNA polymerase-3 subunit gamma/tau